MGSGRGRRISWLRATLHSRLARAPEPDEMVLISNSMVAKGAPCLFVIRNFDNLFLCISLREDNEQPEGVHARHVPELADAVATVGRLKRGQMIWRPNATSTWRSYRFSRVEELDGWLEGQPVPLLPRLAPPA